MITNRQHAAAMLAFSILAAPTAQAAERSVTLAVENMTCASCPYIVRQSLLGVRGVSTVVVSSADKTARVTFDDALVGQAALISATTNAGYPSAPIN